MVTVRPILSIKYYKLPKILNGNIEPRGIDDSLSLELHPHTISVFAREIDVELHLGTTIGDERMGMNHVDEVVTGGEHMAPRADVLLDSISRLKMEEHHRFRSRNGLRRICHNR